jgi:predicted enzyme related to lactoylglutathione lyase
VSSSHPITSNRSGLKERPQQIHLDFYVQDVAAAHEKAVGLGAKVLQVADHLTTDNGFQVYADPAGHPFCLCWVKTEQPG